MAGGPERRMCSGPSNWPTWVDRFVSTGRGGYEWCVEIVVVGRLFRGVGIMLQS